MEPKHVDGYIAICVFMNHMVRGLVLQANYQIILLERRVRSVSE